MPTSPADEDPDPMRTALLRLEGSAQAICDGIELFDPDRIERALGRDWIVLGTALPTLMAEPVGAGPELDLAAVLRRCAARVALAAGSPSNIQFGDAPAFDTSHLPADELQTALFRLLHVAIDAVSGSGDVRVNVAVAAAGAAIDVVARLDGRQVACHQRCLALAELARSFGGQLVWRETMPSELALTLRLPTP